MANIFDRVFRPGKDKGPSLTTETAESVSMDNIKEIKESVIQDFRASNSKVSYTATDVSSADEAKTIELYRHMDNDAVISAALDLYADNATQKNTKTGHVVAIESSDKGFKDELNDFLWNIVKIDTEAWQYVRDLARDGKLFLDTKPFEDGREWAFTPVEEPASIKPLVYGQDKIKYFVYTPDNQKTDDTLNLAPPSYGFSLADETGSSLNHEVQPSSRYIAAFNTRIISGNMTIETETFDGEKVHERLRVKSGRSILASVVQTWQTLSALEDAMFINRLTKSTEFKIVQIDISESNNKQAEQIIKSVQNAFRSSETIDEQSDRYKNRQSPIPVNDFIYVPVKGEKGAVTVTPVGGDMGTVDTSDIDYYRNKLFAGLGMLKAYLGFEETTPGGLGDNTMTKLDERLGRRVSRLQQLLESIVIQVAEYYWTNSVVGRTIDKMPEYKVILGKISTKEEQENRDRLTESISIASSFLGLVQNELFKDMVNKEKLFEYVFTDLLGLDVGSFNNIPTEEDITLRLHKIQEKAKKDFDSTKVKDKHKSKSFTHGHTISDSISTLLNERALKKLEELFRDTDISVEDTDGNIIAFREAIKKPSFRTVLTEATYKQLKDMSKSKDPERIKKSKKLTAKYTGIDDQENVTFVVTAEDPKKNSAEGKPTSYKIKIALKDLGFITDAGKESEKPPKDSEIVKMALQGDVEVSCSCPAAKYWGQQYHGTKDDYSIDKNTIPPKRNIPTQVICKHTILALTVLPFWHNTIVRDLRKLDKLPSKTKAAEKKAEETQKQKES